MNHPEMETCKRCRGAGEIIEYDRDAPSGREREAEYVTCPDCGGGGRTEAATRCGGEPGKPRYVEAAPASASFPWPPQGTCPGCVDCNPADQVKP